MPGMPTWLRPWIATALLTASLAFGAPANAAPLDQMKAEAAALATKLGEQARTIVGLDRRYREATDRVAGAQAAVSNAENGLAAVQRRHAEARSRLIGDARLAYVSGGVNIGFKFSAPGGSPEAVSRTTYLRLVSGQERRSLESLRAAREDLSAQKERQDQARQSARAQAARAGHDRVAAQSAMAEQRALLSRVNGQVATLLKQEQARRDGATAAARNQIRAPGSTPASGSPGVGPRPRPRFTPSGPDTAPGVVDEVFACIRQLESGNRYGSIGGGAYQFQDPTWQSLGYKGTARDASPEVQDEAARRLQARDGWRPWTTAPLCGRP